MKSFSLLRHAFAGLLLALAGPALAQTSAEAFTADEQQRIESLLQYANGLYTPKTDERFDPDLRKEVRALLADYRARFPDLFRQWVRELRSEQTTESDRHWALLRRFIAANALVRAETVDAQDDKRWFSVVAHPQNCIAYEVTWGALPLAYLQALPKDQRAAALKAERERMRRFGRPQQTGLHAPLRDWLEEVRIAVQAVKSLGVDQAPPLPPVLIDIWLGEEFAQPMGPYERCAAAQWWLKLPRIHASEAEQLAVMRYAMAPQAADYVSQKDRAERAKIVGGIGVMASHWNTSGVITLRTRLDTKGHIVKTSVEKRVISVAGLGTLEPLAFETLLDASAAAQARTMKFPIPKLEDQKDKQWEFVQQYQFNVH